MERAFTSGAFEQINSAKLSSDQIAALESAAERVAFVAGETICDMGDMPANAFVLLEGEVRIESRFEKKGSDLVGGLFEASAILSNLPQEHRLSAEEPTVLLRFGRREFQQWLAQNNPIARALLDVTAETLVTSIRKLNQDFNTLVEMNQPSDS